MTKIVSMMEKVSLRMCLRAARSVSTHKLAAVPLTLALLSACSSGYARAQQISLAGVSPAVGATNGSTVVELTGANFSPSMSVWFAAQQAQIVNYVNSGDVFVQAPAHAAGMVEVGAIIGPGNRASLGYAFTYQAQSSPTLTGVSPSGGPANTTAAVTLTGSNFQSGARVLVSGAAATNVVVRSSTQITATLPAMSAGSYTVEVVNPDNSMASLANAFSYAAALTIVALPTPVGTVGQSYSTSAEAAGGTQPYTWTLTSGSLPPGLTGTIQGALSGAPTTAGTYNFVVQVQDAAGAKASDSAAITVQTANKPRSSTPSGTPLGACQAITASGAYYLNNDVTCTNQGFAINADNVTLNLNGHTITYGTGSAVVPAISICDQWYSQLPGSSCGNGHHAAPTITNGTITQASSSSPFTHAIWIGQGNGISGGTLSNLTINISAPGTQAIYGEYPGAGWTIQSNVINDSVTNIQHAGQIPLSARSQFQGVAIKFDDGANAGGPGDLIEGNTINGSPQGGIIDSNQNTKIINNVITLSSFYSNDYGITMLSDGEVAQGNVVNGRGRGIDAESSNFSVIGNTVSVHEEANNSEYGGCEWRGSDGIRIKNYPGQTASTGWTVQNNTVSVQATYCEAHGLRFSDIGNTVSGQLSNNSFTTTGTQGDYALSFSGVYQPALTYQSNAFAGNTCAQIDNDANTDGANTSVQAGQTWSCGVQAVFDNDLTAGGGAAYSQALTLGDVPANKTITCGGYAEGLIKLGSTVTKQCGQ